MYNGQWFTTEWYVYQVEGYLYLQSLKNNVPDAALLMECSSGLGKDDMWETLHDYIMNVDKDDSLNWRCFMGESWLGFWTLRL